MKDLENLITTGIYTKNADQVTITDLERRAIAHYIKETHKKLEKLRDDISTDLTCNYMHDKACNGPSYARSYVEDIKYRLNAIQCDLDKVANRKLWESEQ